MLNTGDEMNSPNVFISFLLSEARNDVSLVFCTKLHEKVYSKDESENMSNSLKLKHSCRISGNPTLNRLLNPLKDFFGSVEDHIHFAATILKVPGKNLCSEAIKDNTENKTLNKL